MSFLASMSFGSRVHVACARGLLAAGLVAALTAQAPKAEAAIIPLMPPPPTSALFSTGNSSSPHGAGLGHSDGKYVGTDAGIQVYNASNLLLGSIPYPVVSGTATGISGQGTDVHALFDTGVIYTNNGVSWDGGLDAGLNATRGLATSADYHFAVYDNGDTIARIIRSTGQHDLDFDVSGLGIYGLGMDEGSNLLVAGNLSDTAHVFKLNGALDTILAQDSYLVPQLTAGIGIRPGDGVVPGEVIYRVMPDAAVTGPGTVVPTPNTFGMISILAVGLLRRRNRGARRRSHRTQFNRNRSESCRQRLLRRRVDHSLFVEPLGLTQGA